MRHLPLLVAAALVFLFPLSAQQPAAAMREPVKLTLVGGDSITGTMIGVKDGEVSVNTDYGVIRVPVAKLTDESRKKIGISVEANDARLEKRISELEALVERLRTENAQLRRQLQQVPPVSPNQVQPLTGGEKTTKVTPPEPAKAGGYWISSTAKRHNSRCRYYATSKGHSGSASEGVACKVCGG